MEIDRPQSTFGSSPPLKKISSPPAKPYGTKRASTTTTTTAAAAAEAPSVSAIAIASGGVVGLADGVAADRETDRERDADADADQFKSPSHSADQSTSLHSAGVGGSKMMLADYFLPDSHKTSPDAWQVSFAERVKAIENRKKVYSVVFPKGVKTPGTVTGPNRDVPHQSPATTTAASANASAAAVEASVKSQNEVKAEGEGEGGTEGLIRTAHRADSTYALDGDLSVLGSTVDDSQSLVSSISLSALPVSMPQGGVVGQDGKDKGKSRVMRGGGKGPGNGSPVRVGAGVGTVAALQPSVPISIPADQRHVCAADLSVSPAPKRSGASNSNSNSAAGGAIVPRTGGVDPSRGKGLPASVRATTVEDKERDKDKDKGARSDRDRGRGVERKVLGVSASPDPSTRKLSPVPPQSRVPLTRTAPPTNASASNAGHTTELKTPPRQKPAERERERERETEVPALPMMSTAANPFQALALALPATATALTHTTHKRETLLSLQAPAPVSPPAPVPVGALSPSLPQSPRRDSTFLKALMGAINGTPTPRAKSPVPVPMPLNPAPSSSSPRPAPTATAVAVASKVQMDGSAGVGGVRKEDEERENIRGRENAPLTLTPPPAQGGRSPVRLHVPIDAAVSPFAAITAKRN